MNLSPASLARVAAPVPSALVLRDKPCTSVRVGQEISPYSLGIATIGTALGAYHGYKRNNSIGWAIAWGLLGGTFPIIAIPIALAQGFGKRKGR